MWTELLLGALLAWAPPTARAQDDDDTFNLSPNKGTCRGRDGQGGICVHYSYCNSTMHYLPYGIIDQNEERVGKDCPGAMEFCCTPPADLVPSRAAAAEPGCAEGDAHRLELLRVGGNPHTMTAAGRICEAVLLSGGRAALTAASCVRAARGRLLRVLSRSGERRDVASATLHPQYDSGTKERDLAVLVLSGAAAGAGCGLGAAGGGDCRLWGDGRAARAEAGRCGGGSGEGAACVRAGDGCGAGAALVCAGQVAAVLWGASCGASSLEGAAGEWVRGVVAQFSLQERGDGTGSA